MLNIFNLQAAVNEATTYGSLSNEDVAAHPFTGLNLVESIHEGISLIIDEAACYSEYTLAAEEIMVEATLANPDRMDILSENIFDTIKAGAKKFFDKIISVVKGIIDKLKAYFFKFMGKTGSWVKLMKPKIQNAQNKRAGNAELTAEMHEWDTTYITEGMTSGIKTLLDEWRASIGKVNYQGAVDSVKKFANSFVGTDPDSFKENTEANLKREIEDAKDAIEEIPEVLVDEINKNLGVDGTDTATCLSEIRKKGNGGEKTTVKYGSNVSSMLTAVENSAKTIKNLEKTYNEYLKELTKHRDSVSKTTDIKFENEDKMPGNAATLSREKLRVSLDTVIKYTTAYHSATDGIRQINIGLINDMTKEYMTVLTKFAGAKEPKKD